MDFGDSMRFPFEGEFYKLELVNTRKTGFFPTLAAYFSIDKRAK